MLCGKVAVNAVRQLGAYHANEWYQVDAISTSLLLQEFELCSSIRMVGRVGGAPMRITVHDESAQTCFLTAQVDMPFFCCADANYDQVMRVPQQHEIGIRERMGGKVASRLIVRCHFFFVPGLCRNSATKTREPQANAIPTDRLETGSTERRIIHEVNHFDKKPSKCLLPLPPLPPCPPCSSCMTSRTKPLIRLCILHWDLSTRPLSPWATP